MIFLAKPRIEPNSHCDIAISYTARYNNDQPIGNLSVESAVELYQILKKEKIRRCERCDTWQEKMEARLPGEHIDHMAIIAPVHDYPSRAVL